MKRCKPKAPSWHKAAGWSARRDRLNANCPKRLLRLTFQLPLTLLTFNPAACCIVLTEPGHWPPAGSSSRQDLMEAIFFNHFQWRLEQLA